MSLSNFGGKAGRYVSKNSPAIFLGLSIAGVLTTVWLTHRATQKAQLELKVNGHNAALITAATLSEAAFSEYKGKMVEALGKGKETKAVDELIQKKVTEKETSGDFIGLSPREDNQEQYVFDTYSGRVLVSTVEKLNKAANEVALEHINHDYASLNLFYRKIGLPEIPVGDTVGWNNSHAMEIDLGSAVVHENKGLIAIKYMNQPVVKYDTIW